MFKIKDSETVCIHFKTTEPFDEIDMSSPGECSTEGIPMEVIRIVLMLTFFVKDPDSHKVMPMAQAYAAEWP